MDHAHTTIAPGSLVRPSREGVFTLGNPGHLLFGGGLALVVIGSMLLVAGQSVATERVSAQGIMVRAVVTGIGALAAISLGLAALGGGGLFGGHAHTTPASAATPCASGSVHTHSHDDTGHHPHGTSIAVEAQGDDHCRT
ncbi:MAG: hypothetical protein AB7N70_30295 [Dehalococcoidia bacterium]